MAIFTAVATVIGGVIGLGSFGISVLSGVLATGAQFLLSKYTNRPKKRRYTAFSSERQIGGDVPRQAGFGITAMRGHYVRYFKWGAGNAFNADVIVLSDGWCDGLEPYIILDGKRVDLVAKPTIGNEVQHFGISGFESLTSIRYYDGRPGQGADAKLITDTGGDASADPSDNVAGAYNGSDKGTNMAYLIFEKRYSSEWTSEPDPIWVHRGLRCFDPRDNSQDIVDPAGWQFSSNPAVQRTTYLAGAVRGLASDRVLLGMGKPASHIDLTSHIVAANVADETRLAGGGTVKRYESHVIAQGNDDHSELLKEFDDALAGYGVNRNGLAAIVVGAPQVPVLEITSEDILAEQEVVTTPRRSSDELFNHFTGQFTSIESLFEPESLKPVRVNADVAADKQINQVAYDFLQVTDPHIGQYLLNIRYRQNRLGGSVTMAVFLRVAFQLNAGDWVTWNGKTWIVANKDGGNLTLQETSADIYLEAGIEAGPVVVPPTVPANPSVASTVADFAVQVGSIQGAGNAQSPSLRFSWTPPEDPTITDVVIKYWSTANPSQVFTAVQPDAESGEFQTTANVEPGQIYVAKATIVTTPDRFKTFTSEVTTAAATPSRTLQVDLSGVAEAIREPLEIAFTRITSIQEDIAQLSHDVAQEGIDVRYTTELLKSALGGAQASIRSDRAVRTSENSALAQLIDTLRADVDDNIATAITGLQTEVQEVEDDLVAVASALTSVEVKADNATAQGLFQVEAVSGPAGVTVRMALRLRENTTGAFVDSGIFLDLLPDGQGGLTSRIVQKADQLVFVNDTGDEEFPMVFDGGVLRLNVADIGTVNTGVIDLQNGYIIS